MKIGKTCVLLLLAFGMSSCASDPLIGTWRMPTATDGSVIGLTLAPDGTASSTYGSFFCSGSLTYSGMRWTSTATTITVTGSAACSGMMDCSGTLGGMLMQARTCQNSEPPVVTGPCQYALSSDGNTLTLSDCPAGSGAQRVYMRLSH